MRVVPTPPAELSDWNDRVAPALHGVLSYRVLELEECVEEVTGDNLVVTNARATLARLLGGTAGRAVTHIGVGTSGTAPAAADVGLAGAVLYPISAVAYPTPYSVQFTWEITRPTANGLAIREFGLFGADGTLIARKTRPAPINKNPKLSIQGTWTLTF